MKATKAYIASLGTTGTLVASSLLLLGVVSAIVAFKGWPGGAVSDRIERVVVDGGERPFELSGPARLARDAAPAAAAVAGAPAALAGAPGPGAGGPAGPPGGTSPGTPGGGLGDGGGGGVLPGGPVPVNPPPGLPGEQDVKDRVADTTTGTTRQLGDAVKGVSPQTGQVVTDTGQAVSDIVRGLPDVGSQLPR